MPDDQLFVTYADISAALGIQQQDLRTFLRCDPPEPSIPRQNPRRLPDGTMRPASHALEPMLIYLKTMGRLVTPARELAIRERAEPIT